MAECVATRGAFHDDRPHIIAAMRAARSSRVLHQAVRVLACPKSDQPVAVVVCFSTARCAADSQHAGVLCGPQHWLKDDIQACTDLCPCLTSRNADDEDMVALEIFHPSTFEDLQRSSFAVDGSKQIVNREENALVATHAGHDNIDAERLQWVAHIEDLDEVRGTTTPSSRARSSYHST